MRRNSTLFAFVFLAMLCVPLADWLFPFLPRYPLHENRRLADAPTAAAWQHRPLVALVDFRHWFRDRFGARSALVRLYDHANRRLFDDTGNVIAGRDGWLFLERGVRADVANPLPIVYDLCGRAGFAADTLDRWVAAFKANHQALAARGIGYHLVIAPNKHTLYPQYLDLPANCPGRPGRLDALRARLERVEGFHWVELAGPMRAAANAQAANLYHRSDSHWNGRGAELAYRIISRAPGLEAMSTTVADEVVIDLREDFSGDLAQLAAGADATAISETAWDMDLARALAVKVGEPDLGVPHSPIQAPATWRSPVDNGLHALVFHDSFFHGDMQALLAESFAETTFVWGSLPDIDLDAVDALAPDVVIHQMVERTLLLPGLWAR